MTIVKVAPYKPDRFDAAVDVYVKYRVRYAPELLEWLARETGLGPDTVVADLGCGPGFIANAMAPHTGRVVGIDPSAEMLAAARIEAPGNVTYVEGSSFDLSVVPRGTQLLTMGRSFHWMDRDATLAGLDARLAPEGAVAIIGDSVIKGPDSAWFRAANDVARSFSHIDACGKHRHSDDWETHEAVLTRSAFSRLRRIGVTQSHSWSFEAFLGYVLSRSGSTEALLGDQRPALEAALRDALEPFGPGPWTALHEHFALIARRP